MQNKIATVLALSVLFLNPLVRGQQRNDPGDVSKIRGSNYESAPTIGHKEMWLQYNPAERSANLLELP